MDITQAPILVLSVDLRWRQPSIVEPMTVEQKKQFFALLLVGLKKFEVLLPWLPSQLDFICSLVDEEDQVPDDVYVQVLTQARPRVDLSVLMIIKRAAKKAIVHVYNQHQKNTGVSKVFRNMDHWRHQEDWQ